LNEKVLKIIFITSKKEQHQVNVIAWGGPSCEI
jgi:hypothetical protein